MGQAARAGSEKPAQPALIKHTLRGPKKGTQLVLRGRWMIVTHGNGYRHGYQIDRVDRREGTTTIVLTSDHGLTIEGDITQEKHFPRRRIQGQNTFVVPLSSSLH